MGPPSPFSEGHNQALDVPPCTHQPWASQSKKGAHSSQRRLIRNLGCYQFHLISPCFKKKNCNNFLHCVPYILRVCLITNGCGDPRLHVIPGTIAFLSTLCFTKRYIGTLLVYVSSNNQGPSLPTVSHIHLDLDEFGQTQAAEAFHTSELRSYLRILAIRSVIGNIRIIELLRVCSIVPEACQADWLC